MREIEEATELAITFDVVARIAIVILGNTFTKDEVNEIYNVISDKLSDAYEEKDVEKVVNEYRAATLVMSHD